MPILKNIIKRPTTRRTSKSDKVDLFYINNGHDFTLAAYVDEALADEIIGRAGLRSQEEIQEYINSLRGRIINTSSLDMRSYLEGQLQALLWVTGLGHTQAYDMMEELTKNKESVMADLPELAGQVEVMEV